MSDSPAAILHNTSGTEVATVANPLRVDPTGTTTQPVSQGTATNLKAQIVGAGTAGTPTGGIVTVQGDPSGTPQPISGSVTANIGTSGSLALDATLTGGTQKAIVRGGAKGSTTAADVTSTSEGTDHQALDVQVYHGSTAINPTAIRALTSSDVVTAAQATAANLNATVVQSTAANLNATVSQGTATNLKAQVVGAGTAGTPTGGIVTVQGATGGTALPMAGICGGGWSPTTPTTFFGYLRGEQVPFFIGPDGTLQTYSEVYTDAGSFRDDYIAALTSNLTGTVTFTNGSTVVTGVGCAFTTELDRFSFIRNTAHAEGTLAAIGRVIDNNNLVLVSGYTGANVSGVAIKSSWDTQTGSGGSISVANSTLLIAAGTTNGANTWVQRGADYSPMDKTVRFSLSARRANQTVRMGFFDDFVNPKYQATIDLTGTDNTQVTLVTRSNTGANDIESTTVTLPSGLTTAALINLVICFHIEKVTLFLDPADGSAFVFIASHKNHIPPPYVSLLSGHGFLNTGVPAGATTLTVDMVMVSDYNLVRIQPDLENIPDALTAVCTNVAAAVADTLLIAANRKRKSLMITNDSTSVLYLKYGSGSSTTSFTVKMSAGSYYEFPTIEDACYNGAVYGYWAAANGAARITEI